MKKKIDALILVGVRQRVTLSLSDYIIFHQQHKHLLF